MLLTATEAAELAARRIAGEEWEALLYEIRRRSQPREFSANLAAVNAEHSRQMGERLPADAEPEFVCERPAQTRSATRRAPGGRRRPIWFALRHN